MRNAFIEELCDIARERQDVVLLTGDLGFSVLEKFAEEFPDRYFNVGIAEQNMAGMAAGLALSGLTVVTYSIANFALVRCLEQLRNDVCYHDAAVIVVSVGTGVAYGSQGYTHHGIEDMAFTRVLPNMAVIAPADPVETRHGLRALIARRGPASLRLGRGGEPVLHDPQTFQWTFGKAVTLHPPQAITFLSTGVILKEVLAAADLLKHNGIKVGVLSVPAVEPLDHNAVIAAARQARLLITVEEHVREGGFGGAVAEIVAGLPAPHARLIRAGIPRSAAKFVGDQNFLRQANGIDAASLAGLAVRELTTSAQVAREPAGLAEAGSNRQP